ncbi:hypothetical protein HMH01_14790 [Halovulum dunhuangense]|uniref:Uncharacterized protein n=1 Tax=Halovulum dunhuangense TaxID=1505036 RepID=A0A849L5P0_9RHOB|nr:hypothetical protein [Halovulum dunhuangense]NNU81705.1 hypothetical protein [Halovulum dunhuangense]
MKRLDDYLCPARDAVEDARQQVLREIVDYPRPISGCDAQFNHLLDLRRRLETALAVLERSVFVPTSRHPG